MNPWEVNQASELYCIVLHVFNTILKFEVKESVKHIDFPIFLIHIFSIK